MATVVENQAEPIWGQVAQITSGEFHGWTVTSNRTDGTYRITSSALPQISQLPPLSKAMLTTWIVDQHRFGEAQPMINTDVLARLPDQRPLTYRQKVDRFFMMLRRYGAGLGSYIRIYGLQDPHTETWGGRASAWTEAAHSAELSDLIAALKDEGLLREDSANNLRPTAKGLERLDSLGLSPAESDQAFVAMWFTQELDEPFTDGFEGAIRDNGYRAMRIDKKEHANKIDDEIIAEIRRSRFVVADFTSELIERDGKIAALPRGGVYYEAGFAQGLGIPVIWTVRSDCIDYVHFDTRQYAHVIWEDAADLREKLRNRIGAVIGSRTQ
jgi:nucleoside 2-deoxyribosyltransferase